MLRLNTSKSKKSYFHILRKPGFTIPPENYLYECRPPEEVKIATGPIIKNKYGKVKVRGGPANLGKISGNLTQAPRQNVRNVFLPQRQSFNPVAPRTSRISEEEQKRIKEEDVARNGQLIQVSNKTLNRVFDKFGLFTISDKILEMSRTGKMSKEDVRASALLKLTKEVMNAMREARVDEAKEAIDRIEEKHPGTIPRIDELGNSPEEVAENPLLPLSMIIDAGVINDETFLLMEKLIDGGYVYIDPDTLMIDDIIPLQNILQFSLDELRDAVLGMRDGAVKDLLTYILEQHPDLEEPMEEEPIEEEKMELEEGEIIPKLPPPPPREIGYIPPPMPTAKPPTLNPVEPTPEELEEDEVYAVVDSGNDVGEAIRQYVKQQTDRITKILKGLPSNIPPSVHTEIKRNVKTAVEASNSLLRASQQPDNVLDNEKVQREIQKHMNLISDITNSIGYKSDLLQGLIEQKPNAPSSEVMEDDAKMVEEKLDDAIESLNRPPKDIGEEVELIDPKAMKDVGTKKEVWNGKARRTARGYTKEDLEMRDGKVYIKKSVRGKKK